MIVLINFNHNCYCSKDLLILIFEWWVYIKKKIKLLNYPGYSIYSEPESIKERSNQELMEQLRNVYYYYFCIFSTQNFVVVLTKKSSLCNKLWFSNTYIFFTWWCKPLIFQTWIFSSNRIHSLKYLRSTALDYKDIEIRKS